MALIYESQVLPWSQLKELRMAEYYANRAGDTIQAIECYSQQAGAYERRDASDENLILTKKIIHHNLPLYYATMLAICYTVCCHHS